MTSGRNIGCRIKFYNKIKEKKKIEKKLQLAIPLPFKTISSAKFMQCANKENIKSACNEEIEDTLFYLGVKQ